MCRFSLNITILLVVLICISLNESKPLMYGHMWPEIMGTPVDRTNLIDVSSSEEQDTMITERHKRNCFLYAMKSQNRAPKWMCW